MIVLLNASANLFAAGCKWLKLHSEFGICHRTDRTIGLQIGDHDLPGDTKLVDDMVFDEADNIYGFNFSKQRSFRLLCEVVSYRKNRPMIFC